jgi:hypothetical protein
LTESINQREHKERNDNHDENVQQMIHHPVQTANGFAQDDHVELSNDFLQQNRESNSIHVITSLQH